MSSYDKDVHGCGDGNCIWKRPRGMHTNGGCRCISLKVRDTEDLKTLPPEYRQEVRGYWRKVRRNISLMRDEIATLKEASQ